MAGSDEQAVRATTQAWIDAFNRADTSALVALYDAQALLWGTTSPGLIDTPAGIAGYFDAVFARWPAPRMALGAATVRLFDDLAVSTGHYTLTLGSEPVPRELPARFSFVYRREGEAWRIVDHHSSALPDATALLNAPRS